MQVASLVSHLTCWIPSTSHFFYQKLHRPSYISSHYLWTIPHPTSRISYFLSKTPSNILHFKPPSLDNSTSHIFYQKLHRSAYISSHHLWTTPHPISHIFCQKLHQPAYISSSHFWIIPHPIPHIFCQKLHRPAYISSSHL